MKNRIKINNVCFIGAAQREVESGLLGWIRCLLNDSILLDGLTLRRTKDGRLTISYPGRRDAAGKVRHHLRPKDGATRREIESQIFKALRVGRKRHDPRQPAQPPGTVREAYQREPQILVDRIPQKDREMP